MLLSNQGRMKSCAKLSGHPDVKYKIEINYKRRVYIWLLIWYKIHVLVVFREKF